MENQSCQDSQAFLQFCCKLLRKTREISKDCLTNAEFCILTAVKKADGTSKSLIFNNDF